MPKRIYAGRLAVLGGAFARSVIGEMSEDEDQHLAVLAEDLAHRKVTPTALQQFWYVAGYALAAATAPLRREGPWPAPRLSRG